MLYVGTYSVRGSEGIYALDFAAEAGSLALIGPVAALRNPTFLALSPRGPWLYSVCEERAGAVAAVALSPASGDSRAVNQQSTLGLGPCHLAVAPSGRWLVAANYHSGSVVVLPLLADGTVGPASDLVQHSGQGLRPDRQEGPHAHSVTFDPSGRFVIAADLGLDRLLVYALDDERGKLVPHDPGAVVVEPGSGPRHFTFHPSGQWAYLINELSNAVVAYGWDAAAGILTPLQTLSTLPADFTDTSYCADIHVHPGGRFLYGSNRGHDSLAIFALDPDTGHLEAIGHVSTGGRHPRNFTLTAAGNWLLVANMDTDSIVVFCVSEGGGRLEAVGKPFALPSPVCLLFSSGK
jgi:6-phosphogluconolactonase